MSNEIENFRVTADRFGKLWVQANDAPLLVGDVVLAKDIPTEDAAFDHRDDLQRRIDELNAAHCATCK